MSKKVLMIAYFFPPVGGGGVQRTAKFARYLPDFGWQPIILTVENAAYSTFDPSLLAELPPDLAVYRTRAFQPTALYFKMKQRQATSPAPAKPPSISPKALLRVRAAGRWLSQAVLFPDDKIGWVPYALRQAKQIIKTHQPDLIYSTSAPFSAHIIAERLARQTGLPWVADFRDPYVGDQWSARISPLHGYGRRWLEKKWVQRAQRVIVTSRPTQHDFARRYPHLPATHWETITNGYDEADFAQMHPAPESPFFTLVFVGSAYADANPHPQPLCAAIHALLSAQPDLRAVFRLQFVGSTDRAYRQLLAEAIAHYGLHDVVTFLPSVPHHAAVQSMCNASVLLLMRNTAGGAELVISGKTFEYLRAGRPILALLPQGAMQDLLRDVGRAAIFAPTDSAGIQKQLAHWLVQWRAGGLPSATDDYQAYERRALCKRLATVLDEVTKK